MILSGYIGAMLYGIVCLLLSKLIYKAGAPQKYTRKIVHILVGFEWFILYHTVGVGIHFLAVCLGFTVLLFVSYKKELMPMIASDGDNAPGTVYYGVSMSLMATVSLFLEVFALPFGIAVLCTSVGDGLAGVIGSAVKSRNPVIYKSKTLIGTLSAFVFSALSTYLFSLAYGIGLTFWQSILVGLLSAGLELIADRGLDNILLPIGVSSFAYFMISCDFSSEYVISIVLTPFVIAFALSKNILTGRGVLLALLCDAAISVALGNYGFLLLLLFLLLSVLIDKTKKHYAASDAEVVKRHGARDGVQVIANGIIPSIFAILYLLFGEYAFVIGFSAALAESFSDTAASGIGAFSKKAFDPFRMKRVEHGISGGMSVIGTVASLLAPLFILLIGLGFGALSLSQYFICCISAFVGALFDSALGSLVQAKFKCRICGKITEKERHCEEICELESGVRFITNDVVNLISAFVGASVAIALYCFI